jgi:hypothetical protein
VPLELPIGPTQVGSVRDPWYLSLSAGPECLTIEQISGDLGLLVCSKAAKYSVLKSTTS